MATSGTNTFNLTRDQIITNALSLLEVVAAGETVTANDITFCASLLNSMVKAWMAQGIHLFTEEEGTVYFVSGQAQYNLQASSGANASDGTGTPEETTVSSSSSGTTLNVTSSTGMSIGDNIGIALTSTTLQWTTIANIVGNVITLNASLSSTVPAGMSVYTYTTNLGRVLSIQNARVRDINGFDRSIWIKPRQEYMNIPQKTISGSPTVLYYSPQTTNGQIFVWPTPQYVTDRLKITYLREIQDFDSSTDNADFPQEWLEALTYNLAVRAAPAYGLNLTTSGLQGNPDLIRMAAQFLDDLKAWDAEQPYLRIVPNYRFGV